MHQTSCVKSTTRENLGCQLPTPHGSLGIWRRHGWMFPVLGNFPQIFVDRCFWLKRGEICHRWVKTWKPQTVEMNNIELNWLQCNVLLGNFGSCMHGDFARSKQSAPKCCTYKTPPMVPFSVATTQIWKIIVRKWLDGSSFDEDCLPAHKNRTILGSLAR